MELRSLGFCSVVGAACGGMVEYTMTSGISGWAPFISAVCGASIGWGMSVAPSEKISDFTVAQLANKVKEMTSIEAESTVKSLYRGVWLEVSGELRDVSEEMGMFPFYPKYRVFIRTSDDSYAHAYFAPKWKARVRALGVNDRVTIQGKISDVSDSGVTLKSSKLIRAAPPVPDHDG